jgi:molybdopterin-guanine dinucleotide biosynthesis protein A
MTRPLVVLLAGGLARRMGGGDKCLVTIGGRTILSHLIERLAPQGSALILNANGNPARFAEFGLPIAPDSLPDHPGPLAGVLAGLRWAQQHRPEVTDIVTLPADGPFAPRDLVDRLLEARAAAVADLACAASDGRNHPPIGLWPVRLADALQRAMIEEEMRKVDRWTARHRLATVEFSCDPIDPFFNANTPEDVLEAERMLSLLERRA